MNKFAFTLAEVLITLVIIGVIAALTLPVLMMNSQYTERRSAYKKAINTLNHVLEVEYKVAGNGSSDKDISKIFVQNTNTAGESAEAFAGWEDNSGISTPTYVRTGDGFIYIFPSTVRDTNCIGDTVKADGTRVDTLYGSDVQSCGVGVVDVNGIKPPNRMVTSAKTPEDQFRFTIYDSKVFPGDTSQAADNQPEVNIMYENNKD